MPFNEPNLWVPGAWLLGTEVPWIDENPIRGEVLWPPIMVSLAT
jgi:hypothetical protein